MKKIILFSLNIIIVLSFFSCKHTTDKISDKIVLKIGDVKISEYELLKNAGDNQGFEKLSKKQKQSWLENFIDESYLLCDAYSKGYDTSEIINSAVEAAAKYMLTHYGGYLWEKIVVPQLEVSEKECKEAFAKRNRIFYMDCIFFKDEKEMETLMAKRSPLETSGQFLKFSQKLKKNVNYFENRPSQWPFDALSEVSEIVYGLKEGKVSQPLKTSFGIFIVLINKIETIDYLGDFKAQKDVLVKILQQVKEQLVIQKNKNEIYKKSSPQFNDSIFPAIVKLAAHYENDNPLFVGKYQNDILLSYYKDNVLKKISALQFNRFYNNLPIKPLITSPEVLKEMIEIVLLQDFLYDECVKLKINEDKKYLLDRKNYKNRVMANLYIDKEFRRFIKISLKEVEDYYNAHKMDYTDAKSAKISILTFNKRANAEINFVKIQQAYFKGQLYTFSDTSSYPGLISYVPGIQIERNSKLYQENIVQTVFQMQDNTISNPIDNNKNCIIIIKDQSTGTIIKSLDEVKGLIENNLFNKKFEELKLRRVNELKKKYNIDINHTAKYI